MTIRSYISNVILDLCVIPLISYHEISCSYLSWAFLFLRQRYLSSVEKLQIPNTTTLLLPVEAVRISATFICQCGHMVTTVTPMTPAVEVI